MRWPWVRRSTFDTMVQEAHNLILSIEKEHASNRDELLTGWVTKCINLDAENRELKDEIERLRSIIEDVRQKCDIPRITSVTTTV